MDSEQRGSWDQGWVQVHAIEGCDGAGVGVGTARMQLHAQMWANLDDAGHPRGHGCAGKFRPGEATDVCGQVCLGALQRSRGVAEDFGEGLPGLGCYGARMGQHEAARENACVVGQGAAGDVACYA